MDTGGGPPPPELTPWEEKMTALIDMRTIEGVGGADAGTGIQQAAGTQRTPQDDDDGEEATTSQRSLTSTTTPQKDRPEANRRQTHPTSPHRSPTRRLQHPLGRRGSAPTSPQPIMQALNVEGVTCGSEPDEGQTPTAAAQPGLLHSPRRSDTEGMATPQGSPVPVTQVAHTPRVHVRCVRTQEPDVDAPSYGTPDDRHSDRSSPIQAASPVPIAPGVTFVTGAAVMARLDIIEAKQAKVESIAEMHSRHIKAISGAIRHASKYMAQDNVRTRKVVEGCTAALTGFSERVRELCEAVSVYAEQTRESNNLLRQQLQVTG
ncbi:uncharacterized protein [Ambystoma mexicanum]|uniref:uncharacterized protein n=1 Tax=Ambystoma mexicanum TaxID=8296 RepID=UPI0037E713ED